jgi:hypothetical protein
VVGKGNSRVKHCIICKYERKNERKNERKKETNHSPDSPRPSTLPLFPHLITYVMQCAMADLKIPFVSHLCLVLSDFNTKLFVSPPGVLNRG